MTPSRAPSPDPLLLGPGPDMDMDTDTGDCLVLTNVSPKLAQITPRRRRVQPVVEIPTPRKRKNPDPGPRTPGAGVVTPKKGASARTPAGRASPTPNGKANGGPMSVKHNDRYKGPSAVTPTKKTATPISGSGKAKAGTPRLKGTPTLASSLGKPLPTPSPAQSARERKRPRISTPVAKALTFDEEIFEDPSQSDGAGASAGEISRQTFLANEALRRQREARNFTYKGEASAPKLTRSGRVVGTESVSVSQSEELDEYGGVPEEEDPLGPEAPIIPDVEVRALGDDTIPSTAVAGAVALNESASAPIHILPELARPYLQKVLGTLNSRGIAIDPPPFKDEEKNEPLTGLVNLLKGTVERGEGNSALVVGPRGVGKTRTVARAINLLPSSSKTSPIVVRLSGHAQTNDRLAIREMGRQIAEAEGQKAVEAEEEDEGDEEEYAPTTLPSHLLALLTTPSPRAIIIIIEEFDLFTEHARQALLYCLLDVVQSIKTGPVETTGRGVAVIGVTTRVDTLLLLEKRVKSRFSHRTWRIPSPLSTDGQGWKPLLLDALVPPSASMGMGTGTGDKPFKRWKGDWQFAVEMLLEEETVKRRLDRLTGLSTDVRMLYRPFIAPVIEVLAGRLDFLSTPDLAESVLAQVEGAGWGLQNSKLRGLPHPALGVLIIAKHLSYAGRDEFNLAQVEEEYLRFSRTKLVGSGKVRWPIGVLRTSFDHLVRLSLLVPASNASLKPQFTRVRSTLSPHEVVAYFKGEGASVLGPELGNWGRMMGGHA